MEKTPYICKVEKISESWWKSSLLTSVFRFFPIRVSSIAAISLDAIVCQHRRCFWSKASGSLLGSRSNLSFHYLWKYHPCTFHPKHIIYTKSMKLDISNCEQTQSFIQNLMRRNGNTTRALLITIAIQWSTEESIDNKCVNEQAGNKWYLTFWVGYPGYICRLAHCRCQCYTSRKTPYRLLWLKCQKYMNREV